MNMSPRRSPRFSAAVTSASVLFFCYVALSKGDSDCKWLFDPRPPSDPSSHVSIIPCNPFITNSNLTLPCQVTGSTEVELDWYSSGNVKLMNSTKYSLVHSVTYNNDTVIVSLNLTFSNLNKTLDEGSYFCIAKVKISGNVLSPIPTFFVTTPSFPPFKSIPCRLLQASDSLCADEIQEIHNTSSSLLIPSSHILSSTISTVNSIMSTLTTPSSTPKLTNSLIITTETTTNTPSHAVEQTPLIHLTPLPNSDISSSVSSTLGINKTNMAVLGDNTDITVEDTGVNPPVNTWFYLLSVVVVLTFLMIILVLILVIFCIMKRNNGNRQIVHLPSSAEEIRIQRIGRQPSDPLPSIRDKMMEGNTPISTRPSKLPDHQVTIIPSAPFNDTTGHAMSLQHLAFNLGPSFESNSTLYDEIGPPEGLLPDIVRGSHDYVNRWQFTLQSDSTDASYVLPSDAHGSQELSFCIQAPVLNPHDDNDDITSDNGVGYNMGSISTDGSVWFGQHSPLIVSQSNAPWQDDNTIDVMINIEECSESVCLSQELPEVYSDGESDDSSSCCMVVCESDSLDLQQNTLNGQIFELNLDCNRADDSLLNSDSRILHGERPASTENSLTFHQTLPIDISSTCELPTHLPGNTERLSPNDSDNSRSSSTSGCTDVSKYSGDYDRDPAYMSLLLNRIRPSPTSPDFMNSCFDEVRADSGMESYYREPIPLTLLTDDNRIVYQHDNNNIYKSLNSLSLEPESIYIQSHRHHGCQTFHSQYAEV